MKRKILWRIPCAVALAGMIVLPGLCPASSPGSQADMPNIVVILADDLGYRDLGCYGADRIPTPNCDRLAKEGMMFTDAHSPSAVCSPTRYGVLTGRYSWRTWLKNWVLMEHMPLLIESQRMTVASMLKQKGYVTGAFGKWHLGWGSQNGDYARGVLKPGPLEVGFDTFFGVPYSHNSSPPMQVFVKDDKVLERRNLANTGIDLARAVVGFIEENKNKPFFIYFPTTNVHDPLTPNQRFKGLSRMGSYGDFVVEFDWMVGQVMEAIEQSGLADKTLVMVTSDNGSKNKGSNLPFRGGKGEIFEGGHRIPFIAHWPGRIKAGSTVDTSVCLTDIMPTLAELTGIPLPDTAAEDGESFLPQLQGKSDITPRKPIIHHSVNGMFAIRHGKWKLIDGLGNGFTSDWAATNGSGMNKPTSSEPGVFDDLYYRFPKDPEAEPGGPKGQLYDMEADPGETNNLWAERPEVVADLLKLLDAEREKSTIARRQ